MSESGSKFRNQVLLPRTEGQKFLNLKSEVDSLKQKIIIWNDWFEGDRKGPEPPKPSLQEYEQVKVLANAAIMLAAKHDISAQDGGGGQFEMNYHFEVESDEGEKIDFDLKEILDDVGNFLESRNLSRLVAGLPVLGEMKFSRKSAEKLKEAMEMGFNRAVILPGADLQMAEMPNIISNCGENENLAVTADPASKSETLKMDNLADEYAVIDRPNDKPYLLLYKTGLIDGPTMGKNLTEATEVLNDIYGEIWKGMTLQEYLILQRKEYEKNGDHRFDQIEYSGPSGMQVSQRTIIPSSRRKVKSGRLMIEADLVLEGGWDSREGHVRVAINQASHRDPDTGLRPVVIIPLE